VAQVALPRFTLVSSEFRKLLAFVRRDLLEMLSYRLAFVSDWLSMIGQVRRVAGLVHRVRCGGHRPHVGA
jgi:hypothetical protein